MAGADSLPEALVQLAVHPLDLLYVSHVVEADGGGRHGQRDTYLLLTPQLARMVSSFLVSTVVTGVLLLGVALFLRQFRKWRHDKPGEESSGYDAIVSMTKSPRAWIAAYVVAILAVGGGTWAYVGGVLPEGSGDVGLLVVSAVLGIAIFLLVARGTYDAVRGHGRSPSQAAAMGAVAVGFVLLTAIAVKLVVA